MVDPASLPRLMEDEIAPRHRTTSSDRNPTIPTVSGSPSPSDAQTTRAIALLMELEAMSARSATSSGLVNTRANR